MKYTDNEKHHKNIKPAREGGFFSKATIIKSIPKIKINTKPPNIGQINPIFYQI